MGGPPFPTTTKVNMQDHEETAIFTSLSPSKVWEKICW